MDNQKDHSTPRRKPGAKPSGRPLSRNVGVSLYATDEILAQAFGQGNASRGVQFALRNMNTALTIIAASRSYVKRTRDAWQEAYTNPEHEYYEDAWLLSSIHDTDDLLRRIEELQDAIPDSAPSS